MRYFFEVSYKGTNYAGFQVQKNANTIQAEVEKALQTYFKTDIPLTGSSRTDAGVHALQNYFHGDIDKVIEPTVLYNLNAMLPADIVLKRIISVAQEAHCRFDASAREYHYYIYDSKDPFMLDRAYFYPYHLNFDNLNSSAAIVLSNTNFEPFSKKNAQVKTHVCKIFKSEWVQESGCLVYKVRANRFLRGMVRALVATMLRVGRDKLSLEQFSSIFTTTDSLFVDFASPPQGLFLASVTYPQELFQAHLN
jgi:tRNA pseudouridine38-40 synthase